MHTQSLVIVLVGNTQEIVKSILGGVNQNPRQDDIFSLTEANDGAIGISPENLGVDVGSRNLNPTYEKMCQAVSFQPL
ncbi:MAG: hypothetical protein HC838_04180 [Spirulinaceae cyanobacterium RM2_2_10]|nr:hypothetical protein [Spirulinaceae cyanobacterium RM2_2_10]